MSKSTALKLNSILDHVFMFLLLIGCFGLFVQIYKQNNSLEEMQVNYDRMADLAERRMMQIDALQSHLSDRNDKIELLMSSQAEERKKNEEKIDAVKKVISVNRCVRNDSVSRDIIDRLLKSE